MRSRAANVLISSGESDDTKVSTACTRDVDRPRASATTRAPSAEVKALGAALTAFLQELREKPTFVAPDGGDTTFFGPRVDFEHA